MATWDRLKASLFALVRASNPRVEYLGTYRGVVVSQVGMAVDVRLDDPRLPSMTALPIQVGIPGATVVLAPGARMLVAFENGDPARPIALSWDVGAHALRLSLPADLVELGGAGLNPLKTGVLTGESMDTFSGLPHWMLGNASVAVLARKG